MSIDDQPRTAELRTARYDAVVADLAWTASAPPGDIVLLGAAQAFVAWEARTCDERRFDDWLQRWASDGVMWAPLRADRHPQFDQTLFFDDRRRLGERVARWDDPSAWAHHPPARTVRIVGTVEAWTMPTAAGGDRGVDTFAEVLVRSALTIWEHRRGASRPWPVTQIHRLRVPDRHPRPPADQSSAIDALAGALITSKTIVLLGADDGVPNPAFLL